MDEPSPDAAKPDRPAPADADAVAPAEASEPSATEAEPAAPAETAIAATPSEPASAEPDAANDESATHGEADANEGAKADAAAVDGAKPADTKPAAGPANRGEGITFGRGSRLLFPIVVAIALFEAAAHLYQTRPVDQRGDYERAAAYVRADITKGDGLVFWPDWSSRPGRYAFKEMATLEREGPMDVARYKRLFVVRNRGAGGGAPPWNVVASRDFGVVRVDTLENPSPSPVISSSLELFEAHKVEAFVHGPTEHRACPWVEDRGSAPAWDPAVPPHRFQCDNVGVGLVLSLEHDYRPRYCLAAMPLVAPRVLRLRFKDVTFGRTIVIHHFIEKAFENPDVRDAATAPQYPPVDAHYWAELPEDRMAEHGIGKTVFHDGPGYTEVTFNTPELASKSGVLAVDISAASQSNRQYCFEVTTR